eukprot:SAG31_NODE_6540_length_1982_cov_164.242167_4_plen_63_part_00
MDPEAFFEEQMRKLHDLAALETTAAAAQGIGAATTELSVGQIKQVSRESWDTMADRVMQVRA